MAENSSTRVDVQIHGRVQGVGFRDFTRRQAQRLGVKGWVRNEEDGSVRLVAEGTQSALGQLIEAVEYGPRVAHVSSVDTNWMDAEGSFQKFEVRH